MNHEDIFNKVQAMVVETLEVEPLDVQEDTTFDDLGADSFDKLELVTALEDEFNLSLDDEVLMNIAAISDAVEAIEQAQ